MKKPMFLLATLLALGTSGQLVAQDSKAPKNDSSKSAESATTKVPAALPFEIPPAPKSATSGPAAASTVLSFSDLKLGTNTVLISSNSYRLDTIKSEGLRIEGSAVPVIKRPSIVSFLQLFNPFAPDEYGGTEVTSASQGFGRVFADPVKTGPTTVLLSVGHNPPKPEVRIKSTAN